MNRLLAVSVFIFISLYSNFSFADYVATGHFEGLVCKYFGTVCSYERLDAVKKGGAYDTIKNNYSSVDEYKNGRCHIYNKGLFKQAFYQEQSDGTYKKLKPDYISFSCKKN